MENFGRKERAGVNIVRHNRVILSTKGLSYVEVMIAVAILMIGVLAILHAVALSIEQSFVNLSKDEAAKIAESRINALKNTSYASLASGSESVSKTFGNHTRSFAVVWTIESLSATSNAIQVVVSWTHRGRPYQYSVSSVISAGV